MVLAWGVKLKTDFYLIYATDDIELSPILDLDIGGFSACFVNNVNKSSESRVFYGNDTFYLFFRLHQVRRLNNLCRATEYIYTKRKDSYT